MVNNYSTNLAKALAVLALLGGLTTAAAGPIIYPFPPSLWPALATGWCNGSIAQSDTIKWKASPLVTSTKGWAAFDLDTVTFGAYTYAVIHFDQIVASQDDTFDLRYAPDAFPQSQAPMTLYGALNDANSTVVCPSVVGAVTQQSEQSIPLQYWRYPPTGQGGMLVISWIEHARTVVSADSGSALGEYTPTPPTPPWIEFF
jgi:hypothetical protein